jgi:hypothetical protein
LIAVPKPRPDAAAPSTGPIDGASRLTTRSHQSPHYLPWGRLEAVRTSPARSVPRARAFHRCSPRRIHANKPAHCFSADRFPMIGDSPLLARSTRPGARDFYCGVSVMLGAVWERGRRNVKRKDFATEISHARQPLADWPGPSSQTEGTHLAVDTCRMARKSEPPKLFWLTYRHPGGRVAGVVVIESTASYTLA